MTIKGDFEQEVSAREVSGGDMVVYRGLSATISIAVPLTRRIRGLPAS
jgi:hypothetical protein